MISRRDALKLSAAGLTLPALSGALPQPAIAAQEQGGSVPMFRGNAARTGEMPGPGPSLDKPIVVKWRFAAGDGVYYLAVAEDVVFIGSGEYNLHAIDGKSGTERWRLAAGNLVWARPVIVDGVVFIGGEDFNLYAKDAASGTERWRFAAGEMEDSPAVAEGIVYINGSGRLYALDADSGEERWRAGAGNLSGRAAVTNGMVYISDIYNLYALDAESGDERWRFAPGDTVALGTEEDGVVYVRVDGDTILYALDAESGAQLWRFTSTHYWLPPNVIDGVVYARTNGGSSLYAIEAESGSERWHLTAGYYASPPVVIEGVVYFGSDDSNLYAINAESGAELWRFSAGGEIFASPVVAAGVAYFGSHDFKLYALDAESGTEQWHFATGDKVSSLAVADSVVYIPSIDGYLYALGNLATTTLIGDVVLRDTPSSTGVERGTAKAGDVVSNVGPREEREGQMWAEVTIGDVTGWIPLDAIDPATLPPEGEIEYVYIPE